MSQRVWPETDEATAALRSASKPDVGRSGWLYVLSGPHRPGLKIGRSKMVENRVKKIAVQEGAPLTTEALWIMPNCYEAERLIHKEFALLRLDGEWFNVNVQQVREAAHYLGLDEFEVFRKTLRPAPEPDNARGAA